MPASPAWPSRPAARFGCRTWRGSWSGSWPGCSAPPAGTASRAPAYWPLAGTPSLPPPWPLTEPRPPAVAAALAALLAAAGMTGLASPLGEELRQPAGRDAHLLPRHHVPDGGGARLFLGGAVH